MFPRNTAKIAKTNSRDYSRSNQLIALVLEWYAPELDEEQLQSCVQCREKRIIAISHSFSVH